MPDLSSLEPLLPDDRVGRLGEMLRLAYPSLPPETQVVTFIVPPQVGLNETTGDEMRVPAQAVLALISDHPRGTFEKLYAGRTLMTHAGMLYETWERDAKDRSHYVTTLEDPAYKFLATAAQTHIKKISDLKSLI